MLLLVSCGGETKNNSPEDISSINEKRTVQILIDYERSSLSYNDDATIYLDETEIGNISAGKSGSFQITIETGQHCIQAKGGTVIRHNNSSIIQFTIDDTTQDITFSLKDNSITGWTFSGYYDSSTGQLSYENGIWVTFDESNTEGSDDGSYIVLTDMSGTLTYENNVMHWDDFTSRLLDMDFGSTNMRFEKI